MENEGIEGPHISCRGIEGNNADAPDLTASRRISAFAVALLRHLAISKDKLALAANQ
jgi:hypothetical protein